MNINKYTVDYFFLCVGGGCLLLAAAANAAPPDKIAVCHIPADTPENIQLIQVGSKGGALDDHLAHGDWLATDEMCDAIADNNCDGVAGTAAEEDASCDDGDVLTADSCEAAECVNEPIVATCPCDYDAVPKTAPPWATPNSFKTVTPGILCRISVFPIGTVLDVVNFSGVQSCGVTEAGVVIEANTGLSVDQLNACSADLEVYATALDAQQGITVDNVGTPCPTF